MYFLMPIVYVSYIQEQYLLSFARVFCPTRFVTVLRFVSLHTRIFFFFEKQAHIKPTFATAYIPNDFN